MEKEKSKIAQEKNVISRRKALQYFATGAAAFTLAPTSGLYANTKKWMRPFQTAKQDSPNILWICTDQQRWDTIGALNNKYVHTPNIDRLVREGVSFTRAHVQSPICTPSRSSFLTGKYASTVRGSRNGSAYWANAAPLISATLNDAGFDAALVGKFHLSSAQANQPEIRPENDGYRVFHYCHAPHQGGSTNDYIRWYQDRGVDILAIREERGYVPTEYHETPWMTDRTIDFITEGRDQPWLVSLNIYDPHGPFDAPPEYINRYDIDSLPGPRFRDSDLVEKGVFSNVMFQGSTPRKQSDREAKLEQAKYWAQIDLIDENIGRLLKTLEETGQMDNTMIIFTSDHGDMNGDHGLHQKGCRFYEGLVRVPLIFWYPKMFKQNLQSDALVELVDIVPTLLEIAELPIPDDLQGKSLLPILTGAKSPDHHKDYVRSEFYDTLGMRPDQGHEFNYGTMLRSERFKLCIYHGHEKGELFDMHNDPEEYTNLWDHPDYQDIRFDLMKKSFDQTVHAMDVGPERIGRY